MRSAAAVFATLTALSAASQVPPRLGYQGRLLRADGAPETGVVSMAFWLYDAGTPGTPTLGCDQLQVALSDGYYSVALGGIGGCAGAPPAIGTASFDGRELFLEIMVGGTALSPRQRIVSVPYALRAGTAVNVRGGTVEASTVTVGGAGGVSISQTGISVGTNSVVDASGKATVATGAGLNGNGATASPLEVRFGTAAGTAAEGNDPRLSDARTPLPGSADYIQNQTATRQPGGFSIAGDAIVGTKLTILGGNLDLSGNQAVGFRAQNATLPPVTCAAASLGYLYFDTAKDALCACTSQGWRCQSPRLGSSSNPGASCSAILVAGESVGNGVYWIAPDGVIANKFSVWCDMINDGGGWTLAMRFRADGSMPYGDPRWTSSATFNDDTGGSLDPAVNANSKLQSFNAVAGVSIRGCKQGATPCIVQSWTGARTLQTLFNEPYKAGSMSRATMVGLFGDDPTQPNCNASGINLSSTGAQFLYSGARFGLVGNNEADCGSTDSGWGWGVTGCSSLTAGCGTGLKTWSSGGCGATCVQGHLWIR